MSFSITEQEKKSFIVTVTIFVTLLSLLFYIRFSNDISMADLEGGGGGGGITVNFGDSDVGSGTNYQSEVLKVSNQSKQMAASQQQEEILASDLDDSPAVIETVSTPTKVEPKKVESKPVTVTAPKPSKATSDALANIMGSSNKGGDGDDNAPGNKGNLNGDKNSGSYYGSGGSGGGRGGGTGSGDGTGTGPGSGSGSGGGSGAGIGTGVGDYRLQGRKALTKPSPRYTCNEQGTVFIQIAVDKSGNVISANATRGTTNTAKCLVDQAIVAAKNTRFDKNENASDKQIGIIVYNFKLTD